jgi:hypothetical protein
MKRTPGIRCLGLALVAAVLAVATGFAQPDPAAIIAAARAALGGDQILSNVKTFTVSGERARTLGGRPFTMMIEIACELPDKFVQEETSVGTFTSSNRFGFNGDDLISHTYSDIGPPITTSTGKETPEAIAARRKSSVNLRKLEFSKLMLALFAQGSSTYPIELGNVADASLPAGAADAIEVKHDGRVILELYVDRATHLPVMISWVARAAVDFSSRDPVRPMSQTPGPVSPPTLPGTNPSTPQATQPPPGTVAMPSLPPLVNPTPAELEARAKLLSEQMKAIGSTLPLVEHRLMLLDVRDADGLHWPHRFTEYVEGAVFEDVKLGKYKINARISSGRFKVSK